MEICFERPEALSRAPALIIAAADEAATLWLDARDAAVAPYASYQAARAVWADDKQPMRRRIELDALMKRARQPALERAKEAAIAALHNALAGSAKSDCGDDRGAGYGMNSEN